MLIQIRLSILYRTKDAYIQRFKLKKRFTHTFLSFKFLHKYVLKCGYLGSSRSHLLNATTII